MSISNPQTASPSLGDLEAGLRRVVVAKDVPAALAYFSDDVIILLPEERLEGKEALKAYMLDAVTCEGFSLATRVTKEETTDRLGYTVVDYKVTALGKDGKPIGSNGTLVRVWKKQEDGNWKVIVEIVTESNSQPGQANA